MADKCVITHILKKELKRQISSRFKITQCMRGARYRALSDVWPVHDFLAVWLKKPSTKERLVCYLSEPLRFLCVSNDRVSSILDYACPSGWEYRYNLADPDLDPEELCSEMGRCFISELYSLLQKKTECF